MASSIYIHVPFCKNICSYCDFCKYYYNEKWVNDYLDSLELEIKDRYMDEIIKTIYIGGGTPSSLNEKQLLRLFNILKIIKLDNEYEFTFECNLSDITSSLVSILKKNKVNRVSIGIESFDKDNNILLDRNSKYEDAKNKINLLKENGINNINIDLIYAIKNQSIHKLKKDLKLFNKLNVTHISTYSLMIQKNTKLYNKNILPIDENLDYKMYKTICKYLKRKGFIHYEISNFCKEGYESRHNLVYWSNEEYFGFGPGASGYADGVRYDNTKNLNKYFNGEYISNKEILSEKDIMDYEIILGLRKINGINIKEFYEKYHVNIQSKYPVEELINSGDLIHKNGNIFINPDKLYIMNEILLKLL